MTGLKNAGGALLARLTSALQKHPKRATAALATVLLTGGSGAFAVASLGPDPADLPVRTLTEPVTSLAAGQDLADLTDLQSFSLYRSEYTRSNDTTESLLQREKELSELNATLEGQVAERTRALHQANKELARLATIDALTGLHNRRWFDEKLHEHHGSLLRQGRPFALLVIDADYFKRINDTHGHGVGDAVLRQLARLLLQSVRATDFVARFGGEEFVVLLPDVSLAHEGLRVAEKIRSTVEGSIFPTVLNVTVSIGLGLSDASDKHPTAVFLRADRGLYLAKEQGRNRVVLVKD